MKAMIFGSAGQDGSYLAKLLEQQDIAVIGIDRSPGQISISDYPAVQDLFDSHQADYIFHLAANSTTRHEVWQENHDTLCTGTLNILEAARNITPGAKIFISGSGLQFENKGRPIK